MVRRTAGRAIARPRTDDDAMIAAERRSIVAASVAERTDHDVERALRAAPRT
jgi:hypothetical protein